jgi:hypothetical protein
VETTLIFIAYVSPKRRKLARLTKEPRALAMFDARGGVIVIVIVLPIRGLGRASSEGGEERHDDD